jgi:hypothetical protein
MLDAGQNRNDARPYIFTEKQTRLMFIGSGVLMVATLVGILILTSSRPQGTFVQLDRSQHTETLTRAVESITEFRDHGDGTASIPIDRAMELIVERGVANPFTVQTSE